MKENIEVSYAKTHSLDFGNFEGEGTIKVDKEWWLRYVELRKEFEILHHKLVMKLPDKFVKECVICETVKQAEAKGRQDVIDEIETVGLENTILNGEITGCYIHIGNDNWKAIKEKV